MIKAKQKLTSRPRQSGRTDPRLQIIIETPRGSRNKLKFDSASRQFKLSKVMPEGMMFPYDFGYVASTKAEDGDPLDVLVLTRNDRLITVAEASLLYSETRSLNDLN